MIKVENIDVYGFEHAIRAMRNPMNSWENSDSGYGIDGEDADVFVIGKNDLDLMKRLFKAGVEHRTYARMIYLWTDITAPLYWWKEMDRYMVGKTQISTSTMHKIHAKKFELDDFSHEHLTLISEECLLRTISVLNTHRGYFVSNPKDKTMWWQMIQLLPSSYNQKRTVSMTYETVFKIIRERTGHKLDEWNEFVELLKDLPYVREIVEDNAD